MSLCGSFRKPPEVIWDKSLLLKGKSASADGGAKGCREFTRALLLGPRDIGDGSQDSRAVLACRHLPFLPGGQVRRWFKGLRVTHPQNNISFHVCHSFICLVLGVFGASYKEFLLRQQ